jgi:acyl-CoA thioesterase FadM
VTPIPPFPAHTPRAKAAVPLRFEDVTQDGRLVLEALPNAIGPTAFNAILRNDPGWRALFKNGIVPVLTRFLLEGTPGPFSAEGKADAEGTCRIARTDDGRFVLDVWVDLWAPIGRTHGRTPRQGERALAGRVAAEQVFTRPFAPPGERRVTKLEFDGAPEVTDTRPALPPSESIAILPEGAKPIEPSRRADRTAITFGLLHTDSNMHVNSLVYLRLFEEAALRRFVELGRGALWLGRAVDIAYRKPCFAGQAMRVVQQAFELDGRLGVTAMLVEEKDTVSDETLTRARPHTYAQMLFDA